MSSDMLAVGVNVQRIENLSSKLKLMGDIRSEFESNWQVRYLI